MDVDLPGFLFIDHVALAVPKGELDAHVAAYIGLGFREVHREEVLGTDQVREALLEIGDGPNAIQLLEPLADTSPVQKLIDRNGGKGGFAHIAYRVADIQAAFNAVKAAGLRIIDDAPRTGGRGTTVFFIHPKSPLGMMVEVVQPR